ncbi:aromatic amino acid lyase [Pantoea ananatis]
MLGSGCLLLPHTARLSPTTLSLFSPVQAGHLLGDSPLLKISSSIRTQDALSLRTGAALKLLKTVSSVYHILAIEYLLAAQALAFHGEAQLASGTLRAWRRLRQIVPCWQEDRWLAPEIAHAVQVLRTQMPEVL